jgi:hypothetical protein
MTTDFWRLHSQRFQNSHAPFRVVKGVIFLRKMALSSCDFGVQQFWNRCGAAQIVIRIGKPLVSPPEIFGL